MNTTQKRSRNMEFCRFNERYPFKLAALIPVGRQVFSGSVATTFYYYDTSICVSIGAAPVPTVVRYHNGYVSFEKADNAKAPKIQEDCLIISFRDHTDYDPDYKMSEITRFQLLLALGMFQYGEDPYSIPSFVNRSPYGMGDTTYYYRALKDCRYPVQNLRKAYVDGTMDLHDLWEAAYADEVMS